MNWNEQSKILKKSVEQITTELDNFDKKTDILEFVDKFKNINSNTSFNLVKINLNLNSKSKSNANANANTNTNTNTNANENANTNKIDNENKFLFGDKKIKRKYLMKKIHPDKLNFTINKIKNVIKYKDLKLFESCNFDEEFINISKCVVKILSENLNIMDSLQLLSKNSKLFRYICLELEMSEIQINKLEENFGSNPTKSPMINKFSQVNFSDEILNFVTIFNFMKDFESTNKQIKLYFNLIYDDLVSYFKDNVFHNIISKNKILNILKDDKLRQSNDLERNINRLTYTYDDLWKTKINSENDKISENINELNEQILMFREENHIYLVGESVLSTLSLKDFIEIYKDIGKKNKQIYKYFNELEKKLPIFYEYISKIKLSSYSSSYYRFPSYYDLVLDFELVANQEISRTKFSI